jgi:hypothetical protein
LFFLDIAGLLMVVVAWFAINGVIALATDHDPPIRS